MDLITNRTFDELTVGQSATLTRTLTRRDVELFAVMSGDVNPMHVDETFARSEFFHQVIAHGMWGGALISTVLGTELPGPGTIYLGQTFRFRRPVYIADTVTVTVTVAAKGEEHRVTFDCAVRNQRGETVISGSAEVIAPTEKISRPRIAMPDVAMVERGRRHRQLIELTRDLPPLPTAVVHPVDATGLLTAIEAAREGIIEPVLVGPEGKIRTAAEQVGVDLAGVRVVDVPHSDAAAVQAVSLARDGQVRALIQGALSTHELIRQVVAPGSGLRTERRVSHAYAVDVPRHPRPLIITDAMVNIAPRLDDKRDIVQNAIDLARALGLSEPKVALLAAVETVLPSIRSTVEAAALCKMADRGQITGAELDGPLAFDNAISDDAAVAFAADGRTSRVAGHANVLVVPDLEAGDMLVRQLVQLADSEAAGVILGARVPIVPRGRGDSARTRLAGCAIAVLLDAVQRPAAGGVQD